MQLLVAGMQADDTRPNIAANLLANFLISGISTEVPVCHNVEVSLTTISKNILWLRWAVA